MKKKQGEVVGAPNSTTLLWQGLWLLLVSRLHVIYAYPGLRICGACEPLFVESEDVLVEHKWDADQNTWRIKKKK